MLFLLMSFIRMSLVEIILDLVACNSKIYVSNRLLYECYFRLR